MPMGAPRAHEVLRGAGRPKHSEGSGQVGVTEFATMSEAQALEAALARAPIRTGGNVIVQAALMQGSSIGKMGAAPPPGAGRRVVPHLIRSIGERPRPNSRGAATNTAP